MAAILKAGATGTIIREQEEEDCHPRMAGGENGGCMPKVSCLRLLSLPRGHLPILEEPDVRLGGNHSRLFASDVCDSTLWICSNSNHSGLEGGHASGLAELTFEIAVLVDLSNR